MRWSDPIPKAPSQRLEPWPTNERIQEEWIRYVRKRGAKNTQRNLITYVGVFFRSFDELVVKLEQPDIEAFVERMETKCSKLMLSEPPQCLLKQDIQSCPVLVGNRPFHACAKYRPLKPSGVWSYICAVHRFYEWLRELGRISRNPVFPVMHDYASRHQAWFDERRRKPRRRHLSMDEVRILVTQTPIHHAVAYLLMAKCFLRMHEVLKLSWSQDHCNVDEGWIDIPADWDLGGKRLGNPRIILDAELKTWLRRYRAWWEDRVKRDNDGLPTTDRLLITVFGKPWGKAAVQNFNTALQRNAIRLKLVEPDEDRRENKVNSHCFRAFATTYAKREGVSTADLQVLRGDLSPGAIIRYDDYLARLPQLYRDYAPKLGLD